ncbi:serine/threonine protein kinase [Virgisporangium ochraceum]|uniref:FHA domain-containing protein n=1 Tax=Virgisporangium ochraceum TaxID=65505 RepID=A0A8J4A2M3_9ACTN|nr:serine/threonine protein kinase [Virgisporangium ochraceum]GIJ73043.1 hypothetical protein Voc01_079600 [Virgisporangium ochraceum]
METILVQVPGGPGASGPGASGPAADVHRLAPGDRLTFGRGAEVDVALDAPEVSRLAGEIVAADDFWLLSNFGHESSLVVENVEGGGEYVKVRPRRVAAPIPFEISRLAVPAAGRTIDLIVYAPQHTYAGAAGAAGAVPGAAGAGATTVSPFPLDESARYFQVLVALCEPRLRGESTVALPTLADIGDRLTLTRAAVGYHVGYLCEEKLRIRDRVNLPEARRLEWKREALVSMALRYDLVREEHLALLPARR